MIVQHLITLSRSANSLHLTEAQLRQLYDEMSPNVPNPPAYETWLRMVRRGTVRFWGRPIFIRDETP